MYAEFKLSIAGLHLALDTCSRCGPIFNLVSGTCPTNLNQFDFVGLVVGTKFWSLRLDCLIKIDS